jgi:hypothetical protein
MDATVSRALIVASMIVAGATAHADDPTRPPAQLLEQPKPSAPGQPARPVRDDVRLQAIVRTPGMKPGAMINGWIVRVGDTMDGMRLLSVGENHADLLVDGQRLRLSMTPNVKRVPSAVAPSDHAEPKDPGAPAPRRPARGRT